MNEAIVRTRVPENHRAAFLPGLVGPRRMLRLETLAYQCARALSADYAGGFWEYYRLSNRGGYLAPTRPERLTIAVQGNGFDCELGADAFGIVCSLFALGALAAECEADEVIEAYHALRDYACAHPERSHILAAID